MIVVLEKEAISLTDELKKKQGQEDLSSVRDVSSMQGFGGGGHADT